ncbi:MAG: response regulator [Opitutales bacterium]|nr:response regulator [Opitutales bacterium]
MDILIAEDDYISRKLLITELKQQGYSVSVATDGQEAWEIYDRIPHRLVISDWLMPRMDGLELCQKIRQRPDTDYTYFILLTANAGDIANYRAAMEVGVDDFLPKPMDRNQLNIRLHVAERIIKATSRIKSLENMLTICAYTKKIKIPDEGWQTIEQFMSKHLGIKLSHGIEPNYYESVIRPQLEQMQSKATQ